MPGAGERNAISGESENALFDDWPGRIAGQKARPHNRRVELHSAHMTLGRLTKNATIEVTHSKYFFFVRTRKTI